MTIVAVVIIQPVRYNDIHVNFKMYKNGLQPKKTDQY